MSVDSQTDTSRQAAQGPSIRDDVKRILDLTYDKNDREFLQAVDQYGGPASVLEGLEKFPECFDGHEKSIIVVVEGFWRILGEFASKAIFSETINQRLAQAVVMFVDKLSNDLKEATMKMKSSAPNLCSLRLYASFWQKSKYLQNCCHYFIEGLFQECQDANMVPTRYRSATKEERHFFFKIVEEFKKAEWNLWLCFNTIWDLKKPEDYEDSFYESPEDLPLKEVGGTVIQMFVLMAVLYPETRKELLDVIYAMERVVGREELWEYLADPGVSCFLERMFLHRRLMLQADGFSVVVSVLKTYESLVWFDKFLFRELPFVREDLARCWGHAFSEVFDCLPKKSGSDIHRRSASHVANTLRKLTDVCCRGHWRPGPVGVSIPAVVLQFLVAFNRRTQRDETGLALFYHAYDSSIEAGVSFTNPLQRVYAIKLFLDVFPLELPYREIFNKFNVNSKAARSEYLNQQRTRLNSILQDEDDVCRIAAWEGLTKILLNVHRLSLKVFTDEEISGFIHHMHDQLKKEKGKTRAVILKNFVSLYNVPPAQELIDHLVNDVIRSNEDWLHEELDIVAGVAVKSPEVIPEETHLEALVLLGESIARLPVQNCGNVAKLFFAMMKYEKIYHYQKVCAATALLGENLKHLKALLMCELNPTEAIEFLAQLMLIIGANYCDRNGEIFNELMSTAPGCQTMLMEARDKCADPEVLRGMLEIGSMVWMTNRNLFPHEKHKSLIPNYVECLPEILNANGLDVQVSVAFLSSIAPMKQMEKKMDIFEMLMDFPLIEPPTSRHLFAVTPDDLLQASKPSCFRPLLTSLIQWSKAKDLFVTLRKWIYDASFVQSSKSHQENDLASPLSEPSTSKKPRKGGASVECKSREQIQLGRRGLRFLRTLLQTPSLLSRILDMYGDELQWSGKFLRRFVRTNIKLRFSQGPHEALDTHDKLLVEGLECATLFTLIVTPPRPPFEIFPRKYALVENELPLTDSKFMDVLFSLSNTCMPILNQNEVMTRKNRKNTGDTLSPDAALSVGIVRNIIWYGAEFISLCRFKADFVGKLEEFCYEALTSVVGSQDYSIVEAGVKYCFAVMWLAGEMPLGRCMDYLEKHFARVFIAVIKSMLNSDSFGLEDKATVMVLRLRLELNHRCTLMSEVHGSTEEKHPQMHVLVTKYLLKLDKASSGESSGLSFAEDNLMDEEMPEMEI